MCVCVCVWFSSEKCVINNKKQHFLCGVPFQEKENDDDFCKYLKKDCKKNDNKYNLNWKQQRDSFFLIFWLLLPTVVNISTASVWWGWGGWDSCWATRRRSTPRLFCLIHDRQLSSGRKMAISLRVESISPPPTKRNKTAAEPLNQKTNPFYFAPVSPCSSKPNNMADG